MNHHHATLRKAFPLTIPVMTGYIALGIALGILMESKGYSLLWVLLTSTFVYAGAMQFTSIPLLAAGFHPLNAFIITLMINARFIFYGISMLTKFNNTRKLKPYLIFGLTDETFSLLSSTQLKEDKEKGFFMFFITLFNHIYWVLGSAIGFCISSLLDFNTSGIEFVLTALFVVNFIDKWKETTFKLPLIIGLLASILSRLIFGADNLIIPAMIFILITVTIFRNKDDWRNL